MPQWAPQGPPLGPPWGKIWGKPGFPLFGPQFPGMPDPCVWDPHTPVTPIAPPHRGENCGQINFPSGNRPCAPIPARPEAGSPGSHPEPGRWKEDPTMVVVVVIKSFPRPLGPLPQPRGSPNRRAARTEAEEYSAGIRLAFSTQRLETSGRRLLAKKRGRLQNHSGHALKTDGQRASDTVRLEADRPSPRPASVKSQSGSNWTETAWRYPRLRRLTSGGSINYLKLMQTYLKHYTIPADVSTANVYNHSYVTTYYAIVLKVNQ